MIVLKPAHQIAGSPSLIDLVRDDRMIAREQERRAVTAVAVTASVTQAKQHPSLCFAAFWRLYLQAHRHPLNRALHYLATMIGILSVISAIVLSTWWIAAIGISCCYALAIGSHCLVEHNRSMMATNPLFGYLADLKMSLLALTGGLHKEYDRLGLSPSWTGTTLGDDAGPDERGPR